MATTEDFEDGTLQTGIAESDADGLLTPSSTVQYKEGTHSCEVNLNGAAHDDHLAWDVNQDHAVMGIWYRTAAKASFSEWGGNAQFFLCGATLGSSSELRIREWRSSSTDAHEINHVDSGVSWTISDNTWYWICVEYVRNGTIRIRLYDDSLTQIGSEATWTEPYNVALITFRIGNNWAVSINIKSYFDQWILDLDASTWPLLPTAPSGQPMMKRWGGVPFSMVNARGRW